MRLFVCDGSKFSVFVRSLIGGFKYGHITSYIRIWEDYWCGITCCYLCLLTCYLLLRTFIYLLLIITYDYLCLLDIALLNKNFVALISTSDIICFSYTDFKYKLIISWMLLFFCNWDNSKDQNIVFASLALSFIRRIM